MKSRTLYIHIPFCVRRCIYCAFYLEPLGTGPIAKRLRDYGNSDNAPFIQALEKELRQTPDTFAPPSIYIGGGTPTELSAKDFEQLFTIIHRHIDTSNVQEWTVEANPGTLVSEKMELMLERGVNRLSLGVQSFDPSTLEFLGRLHDANEARETYQRLRQMGYKNISLDLMIAIPGRDNDALQRDIDTLIELAPEHASAYALELDEGAPLRELRDKGLFTEMNEEQAVEQFELLHEKLDEAGIHPYEISNFSKPGFESKHNQHYWDAGEYYGCGPSASGHIDGVRTQNIPSLPTYIAYLQRDRSPISEKECLEPEAKARESLMLALRCRNGIRNEVFESRTGFSYGTLLGEQLDIYIAQGLMELHEGNLRLTQKALFISDSIFSEFI